MQLSRLGVPRAVAPKHQITRRDQGQGAREGEQGDKDADDVDGMHAGFVLRFACARPSRGGSGEGGATRVRGRARLWGAAPRSAGFFHPRIFDGS